MNTTVILVPFKTNKLSMKLPNKFDFFNLVISIVARKLLSFVINNSK